MLSNDEWLHFARNLNWKPRYVSEDQLFPQEQAGHFNTQSVWSEWEEPYKTTYSEYVKT